MLFEPAEVEFHLTLVGGAEATQFQFHSKQPAQTAMEEKQIEIVIFIL